MAFVWLPWLPPSLLLVATILGAYLWWSAQVLAKEVVLLTVQDFGGGIPLGVEAGEVREDRVFGPVYAGSGSQLGIKALRRELSLTDPV